MPMLKYRKTKLLANILINKHKLASIAPAMVTTRQPYLFTKILATGPVKQIEKLISDIKQNFKIV